MKKLCVDGILLFHAHHVKQYFRTSQAVRKQGVAWPCPKAAWRLMFRGQRLHMRKKSLLCHWWDSRYLLPKFSQESKNQPQQKKNEGLRRSGLALFHHSHTIFLSEPQREIWVLLYWSEAMPRQPQRPIWPFCCGKDDCWGCLCLLHIVVLWVYKWLWFWVYNIKKINRYGMIHILSKNTIPMLRWSNAMWCSKVQAQYLEVLTTKLIFVHDFFEYIYTWIHLCIFIFLAAR